MSAAYHLALKRKKISYDSMPGEFVRKDSSVPRRKITEEEFQTLTENAKPVDFKDVLICGYETAMRSNEICTLTVGQVKLDVQHISGDIVDYIDLGIFDTKTGVRRTVPVSPRLKQVLRRRLEGIDSEDRLFTRGGKDYYPHMVSLDMKRTCNDAKIPYGDKLFNKKGERIGIVFHCLRHTRTSKWVEMGFSDEIIRRATGHSTLAAYQKYIKLDPHVVMRLVESKQTVGDNKRVSILLS